MLAIFQGYELSIQGNGAFTGRGGLSAIEKVFSANCFDSFRRMTDKFPGRK